MRRGMVRERDRDRKIVKEIERGREERRER